MNGHYYKTKSKSRTFAKETNMADLIQYVDDNTESDLVEIKGTTNLDPPEWYSLTKHKYIVTITKIE